MYPSSHGDDDYREFEKGGSIRYSANGTNLWNNGTKISNIGSRNTVYHRSITYTFERTRIEAQRERLLALVAHNAMHTGEIRACLRECDSRMYESVIDDTINWIQNINQKGSVLWAFGPARTGKSAFALSVAKQLDKRTTFGQVAGTFFFGAGDPRRSNLSAFVPTLAYQLTVCMGNRVGMEIWRVIDRDPGVFQATIEVQWERLIVETVRTVYKRAPFPMPPAVMIIDGLDECADTRDQIRVLNLIASCGADFPLAFLVVSRLELHLATAFATRPLFPLCRPSINLGECKVFCNKSHYSGAFGRPRREGDKRGYCIVLPKSLGLENRDVVPPTKGSFATEIHGLGEETPEFNSYYLRKRVTVKNFGYPV